MSSPPSSGATTPSDGSWVDVRAASAAAEGDEPPTTATRVSGKARGDDDGDASADAGCVGAGVERGSSRAPAAESNPGPRNTPDDIGDAVAALRSCAARRLRALARLGHRPARRPRRRRGVRRVPPRVHAPAVPPLRRREGCRESASTTAAPAVRRPSVGRHRAARRRAPRRAGVEAGVRRGHEPAAAAQMRAVPSARESREAEREEGRRDSPRRRNRRLRRKVDVSFHRTCYVPSRAPPTTQSLHTHLPYYITSSRGRRRTGPRP